MSALEIKLIKILTIANFSHSVMIMNQTMQTSKFYSPFKIIVVFFAFLMSAIYFFLYYIGSFRIKQTLFGLDTLNTPENYINYGLFYFSILSFFGVLLIYSRVKTTPKDSNVRKTYWGLFIAMLFYFLGEFSFQIQHILAVKGIDPPYPSVSDLFWAIGTILFIEELISVVSVLKVKYSKKQLTMIVSTAIIFILGLIFLSFGDLLLAGYSDDPTSLYTPFMKTMDVFYFTGDALILFACIYIGFGVFSITKKTFDRSEIGWFFLILGSVAMIIGDTLYSFFSWKEADFVVNLFNYHLFTLPNIDFRIDDMFYLLQYLSWLLAFAIFPAFIQQDEIVEEKELIMEDKGSFIKVSPAITDEKELELNSTNLDESSQANVDIETKKDTDSENNREVKEVM